MTDCLLKIGSIYTAFSPNALWADTAGEQLRRQYNLAPGSFLARTPIVYSLFLVLRDLDTSQPLDCDDSSEEMTHPESRIRYFGKLPWSRDLLCRGAGSLGPS